MATPYSQETPYVGYGYGLFLYPNVMGSPFLGHSGGLKGVSSSFLALPKRRLAAVALANLDGFPSQRVLIGAANAVLNRPVRTPAVKLPGRVEPSRSLSVYAGLYGCGEGYWLRVKARRRHLVVDFIGIEVTDRGLRARPTGPHIFAAGPRGSEAIFEFLAGPRGRIWGVAAGGRIARRRTQAEHSRAAVGRLVW